MEDYTTRKLTIIDDLFFTSAKKFHAALGVDVEVDSQHLSFKFKKGRYTYTFEDRFSTPEELLDNWNLEYQFSLLIEIGVPYTLIKSVDVAQDEILFQGGVRKSVQQFWCRHSKSIKHALLLATLVNLTDGTRSRSSHHDFRAKESNIKRGSEILKSAIKVF